MKQSTIFVLALISLSNVVNAGVIREDVHICYNNEGQEIPCKKFISRKEDFGIVEHSKRHWSNYNYNADPVSYSANQGNWWNRNNWNTLNIKNAVKESNANSNAKNYNSGSNNWWNNWFANSNDNNWWKFGNWWNQYSNTYSTSTNNRNNSNNISARPVTTKTLPPQTRTSASKSVPTSVSTTTKPVPTYVPITTKSIPTTTPAPVPTYIPITTKSIPTTTPAPVPKETPDTQSASASVTLPINEFTMTGFNKCSSEQAEILKSLTEDIKTYRASAVYLLQNQNEDETFKKIFLKYYKDNNTFSTVQKTFENINKMTTATAYCETNEDEACADGAMAWTYLNSREFHVCPSFFKDAMFGTISKRASEAASIVLHELTHCHGTEDYAYGERGVSALSASQASNNADSFRLFAMSSIYYLNEKYSGLSKRDDDFLNEFIDFHQEPSFKDEVRVREFTKRDDDFLNEFIDFHQEPSFKDEVRVRPNSN